MADETIRRLFDKLDQLSQQNARLEAMFAEREKAREKACDIKEERIDKLETRVSFLEKSRSLFSGGLGFAAWAISTVLMVLGVMYK